MTSINHQTAALAAAQGIKVNSEMWLSGGFPPLAYQTGGCAAYGWRHDHMPDINYYGSAWYRSVIANYASRPTYYLGEPKRQIGYGGAGRPVCWKQETVNDSADGSWVIDGYAVCGMDLAHFRLGPLFAIYDHSEWVPTQIGSLPSNIVAAMMIEQNMASLAGQVRTMGTYVPAKRAQANIIAATVGAMKRTHPLTGKLLVAPEDLEAIRAYVEGVLLPHWEGPPKPHESGEKFASGVTPPVTQNVDCTDQVYNGLWWLLPSVYDAVKLLPQSKLRERMVKCVGRWSGYILDLEKKYPGRGVEMAAVSFPDSMVQASTAPLSWADVTAHFHGEADWSLWGLRALHVAAAVLTNDKLFAAHAKLVEKHASKITDPEWRAWFVGADGEYLRKGQ